ncbi:MAG: cob(I)yrinic acid a,c-diamide adenosyltransferase [Candidatus Shapirobacteria bacterium]|jgi:cob(I)alamin adenosyltransferase|nr:cob(I)yrinic acid a,c-diamide adenosyltransferase [Candidatus Shapirobacteria bacterium]
MSIITKKGDDGKSRFGGRIVEKDSELLETIGTIDELLALLGVAKMKNEAEMRKRIERISEELHQIMGVISEYGSKEIDLEKEIKYMETEIKRIEDKEESLHKFLETGNRLDEFLNWCRTVVRRCERRVVSLSKQQKIDEDILKYFNRLSDYMFMLSRETKE